MEGPRPLSLFFPLFFLNVCVCEEVGRGSVMPEEEGGGGGVRERCQT